MRPYHLILAILFACAPAIAYSPSRYVPDKCIVSVGFSCSNSKPIMVIDDRGYAKIAVITNNLLSDITIYNASAIIYEEGVSIERLCFTVDQTCDEEENLLHAPTDGMRWEDADKRAIVLLLNASDIIKTGRKYKISINLQYSTPDAENKTAFLDITCEAAHDNELKLIKTDTWWQKNPALMIASILFIISIFTFYFLHPSVSNVAPRVARILAYDTAGMIGFLSLLAYNEAWIYGAIGLIVTISLFYLNHKINGISNIIGISLRIGFILIVIGIMNYFVAIEFMNSFLVLSLSMIPVSFAAAGIAHRFGLDKNSALLDLLISIIFMALVAVPLVFNAFIITYR